MRKRDARGLSSEAQEDLRRRVVAAVRDGMLQREAAKVFGVARGTVNKWSRIHEEGGSKALISGKRGRPRVAKLPKAERDQTIRWIVGKCPDQLLLPFALWNREAVQMLLLRKFGLSVSVWTVGRYLREWGLTPQKPVRRAFEQNPKQVQQWLQNDYPAIEKAAKQAGAEIHWGDEMGVRSDHQAGRSYGKRGHTPVIPGTGQRFRFNMISTITNRGRLNFMVFGQEFTAKVFLRFLTRLLRQAKRKIFLVVDRHPVHRSAPVRRWLARHASRVTMFFLPSYSPELNPDELLNQDVKTNAVGRMRPWTQDEMMYDVRSYLRSRQRRPVLVRKYFEGVHVCYAARW